MKKKKIFVIIFLFTVASLAAFNLNIHSDIKELPDTCLDNIEALAQEIEELECLQIKGMCKTHLFSSDQLSLK